MQGDLPGEGLPESGLVLTVLGTGEAFDGSAPNTSLLLEGRSARLLLDCGPLVPPAVWTRVASADGIDGVWLSHDHADHTFGLPALVGRMWDDGRTKPLAILGGAGVLEIANAILDTGYPSLRGKLPFPVTEVAVEPGEVVPWRGLDLRSAATVHGRRNLCLQATVAGAPPVVYSGDGAPSEASAALCRGAFWVQECYAVRDAGKKHAALDDLAGLFEELRPVRVGLVHVARRRTREVREAVSILAGRGWPVEILEPGARWIVRSSAPPC